MPFLWFHCSCCWREYHWSKTWLSKPCVALFITTRPRKGTARHANWLNELINGLIVLWLLLPPVCGFISWGWREEEDEDAPSWVRNPTLWGARASRPHIAMTRPSFMKHRSIAMLVFVLVARFFCTCWVKELMVKLFVMIGGCCVWTSTENFRWDVAKQSCNCHLRFFHSNSHTQPIFSNIRDYASATSTSLPQKYCGEVEQIMLFF